MEFEDYFENFYNNDNNLSKEELESVISDLILFQNKFVERKIYALYSTLSSYIEEKDSLEQIKLTGRLDELQQDLYPYIYSYKEKSYMYKIYPDIEKYILNTINEFNIDILKKYSIYDLILNMQYKDIINEFNSTRVVIL